MPRVPTVAMGAMLTIAVGKLGVEAALLAAPSPYELTHDAGTSYAFVDRHGEPLREAVGSTGERAIWAELGTMSPWVVAGTIAIEDRRFYQHGGIDPRGVARAVRDNSPLCGARHGAGRMRMPCLVCAGGGHTHAVAL